MPTDKYKKALKQIRDGTIPCAKCKKPHVPYKLRGKNGALQWDNDGHPYYKPSIEEFASKILRGE